MSSISEQHSPMPPPPTQPPISSPDEIAEMEALYKNTKAQEAEVTSVAPWLLNEFTTHKNRLIKGHSLPYSFPLNPLFS
jgi:hypothetical protein